MEDNYGVHSVIIESRNKLNISGVKDVISFDDETVLLNSVMGRITIKGEGIRITGFNTDSGDLVAEGKIHAVVYMSDEKSGEGFFSRLFR